MPLGRQPLPGLSPEPLLRRLRRLRLAGQAEEPRDGRRDPGDQEQLRRHAHVPLLAPRAERAEHLGPDGDLPQRAGAAGRRPAPGDRPRLAAAADLPGPAAHGRRGRHPADRPDDHRRHRDGLRRRGPVGPGLAVQKPGLLLAGRNPVCTDAVATAVMGYDPMAARGPARSPATTTWPWPPPSAWGRTTRRRSRSSACRSRTPCTPSAGSPRSGTSDRGRTRHHGVCLSRRPPGHRRPSHKKCSTLSRR